MIYSKEREPSEQTFKASECDNASFELDEKQWDSFVTALDKPPRNIPALRELLISPRVFDEKQRVGSCLLHL